MAFLTYDRVRGYSLIAAIIVLGVCLNGYIKQPDYLQERTDFPVFYNAGRIVNQHPVSNLYDPHLQSTLFREIARERLNVLFFAYTPFFALLFSPFALLPYSMAFFAWAIFSLALFIIGFLLVWQVAGLPVKYRTSALLIGVSFLPFLAWCLLAGQTSAFGFFCFALAVYLDHKGKRFWSGIALGLLLYKPPLLILVVPMLIASRRWRTFAGLTVCGAGLAAISLAMIGLDGTPSYLSMLNRFSGMSLAHPNYREIDAFSYSLPFVGHRLYAYLIVGIMALVIIPLLISLWRRNSETAWVHAITWTLVLNIYVIMYDSILIILAVILFAGAYNVSSSRAFRWLLLVLMVAPWLQTDMAKNYSFRPMTIALVAFGCYQLWVSLGTSYLSDSNMRPTVLD